MRRIGNSYGQRLSQSPHCRQLSTARTVSSVCPSNWRSSGKRRSADPMLRMVEIWMDSGQGWQ